MTKMIFNIYDNLTLNNSNEEELLAVIADRKLTFHQRIKKTVSQSRSKSSALLRLSPYIDTNKRKTMHTSKEI